MTIVDYNGTGEWSVEEVISRYSRYVEKYRIASPRDLKPAVHVQDERHWIYPVMDRVIEGIEHGDLACAEIGIEFIEEDRYTASLIWLGTSLASHKTCSRKYNRATHRVCIAANNSYTRTFARTASTAERLNT